MIEAVHAGTAMMAGITLASSMQVRKIIKKKAILADGESADYAKSYADKGVEIVSSLPYCEESGANPPALSQI